jgi:hypothetical protein
MTTRSRTRLLCSPTTEGGDADLYAMLWVTRLHQLHSCGSLPYLAERLAKDLRKPGGLAVDLGRTSLEWLRRHANRVVANTLRLNVARLVRCGYLIPDPSEPHNTRMGTLLIALPGHHGRRQTVSDQLCRESRPNRSLAKQQWLNHMAQLPHFEFRSIARGPDPTLARQVVASPRTPCLSAARRLP